MRGKGKLLVRVGRPVGGSLVLAPGEKPNLRSGERPPPSAGATGVDLCRTPLGRRGDPISPAPASEGADTLHRDSCQCTEIPQSTEIPISMTVEVLEMLGVLVRKCR
jgi:hypothetical protein